MNRKKSIGAMIHRIHLLIQVFFRSPEGEALLGPTFMRTLEYIDTHPGCTQAEVAKAIRVTPALVAQNIKKMDSEDYVERIACPENLRSNNLRITQKGRLAAENCRKVFDKVENRMLDGFSDNERILFEEYLNRIMHNLESSTTDGHSNLELTKLIMHQKEKK